MKAAVYERYGPPEVVQVRTVETPEPGPTDVLVKVHSASVSTADWRLRSMKTGAILQIAARLIFGVLRPRKKILGSAFAGRVARVGSDVTRFRVGEDVMGLVSSGAHAEYVASPQSGAIVPKPVGIGFGEAAAAPFGGLSAIAFLRDIAGMRAGQKVFVAGASGGVGVYAVQIAKLWGARVTALTSTANVDLVRSLGADRVIDYKREDFTAGGERYDIFLDTAGVTSFRRVRHLLTANGLFVPLEFGIREILQAAVGRKGHRRVKVGISGDNVEDLSALAALLDQGSIRAVIDSTFPLKDIVAAHRRVETRHKTGAAVVDVAGPITIGSPTENASAPSTRTP